VYYSGLAELFEIIFTTVLTIALLVVLTFMLRSFMRERYHVFRLLGILLIWSVGLIILLAYFGVKTEVLMLLIGLAGISLVLSLKPVVSSWISLELFIKAKRPFKVGDGLSVGGFSGRVVNLDTLVTVLATPDGHIIYFPNYQFLEIPFKVVSKEGVRVRVYFTIPYDKFEEFKTRVSEVSFEVRSDLMENEAIEVFAKNLLQDKFVVELIIPIKNPNKKDDVVSTILEKLAVYL
jgi:small conductance mechanosensitive channel